jgi:hypothetical protein
MLDSICNEIMYIPTYLTTYVRINTRSYIHTFVRIKLQVTYVFLVEPLQNYSNSTSVINPLKIVKANVTKIYFSSKNSKFQRLVLVITKDKCMCKCLCPYVHDNTDKINFEELCFSTVLT